MKIAKRTLFVEKKKLEEFFGLPEGVEIMAVRPSSGFTNGWEFLIASAGEVEIGDTKITIIQEDDNSLYRRISLDTLASANREVE